MNNPTSNQFIDKFKNALEKEDDKNYLIENEFRNLKNFILLSETSEKASYFNFFDISNCMLELKYNYEIIDFKEIFEKFINEGIYDNERYSPNNCWGDVKYTNTIDFAQYYIWLKELKENSIKKPNTKKSTLTHKQKMLVLHYLGLDLSKLENTNTAPILSQVIDFGADNTRIYLSYVSAGKNEVRTEKNLEKVAKLFESQNLTDISSRIREDLEKIK